MKVKLGMSPISWSNDDLPELGGNTSLEKCLTETRKAGYTGTENGGKFPKKANELDHLGIFSENEKTVKIIEWPDLIKTPLTNKLEIHFEYGENDKERKMKIYAIGKWKDFENEI